VLPVIPPQARKKTEKKTKNWQQAGRKKKKNETRDLDTEGGMGGGVDAHRRDHACRPPRGDFFLAQGPARTPRGWGVGAISRHTSAVWRPKGGKELFGGMWKPASDPQAAEGCQVENLRCPLQSRRGKKKKEVGAPGDFITASRTNQKAVVEGWCWCREKIKKTGKRVRGLWVAAAHPPTPFAPPGPTPCREKRGTKKKKKKKKKTNIKKKKKKIKMKT